MNVRRDVRLQIGRRLLFSSVLIAPSVMPVVGSLTPRLLMGLDLHVRQHVAALVDDYAMPLVVLAEEGNCRLLGAGVFQGFAPEQLRH